MISIRDLPLRCPCCRSKTLRERGGFEICSVCFWQDDGQDDEDADKVLGGPDGEVSGISCVRRVEIQIPMLNRSG
ncbi:hypothetical protein KTE65_18920 [Burkholderia multivorans]|uniref:CPCC family cysteine-rich protein n=1 Tax=Burkholderia multivorans TaxID=87883 RepID=UPI001C23D4DB|nr:hypothetical protein [Burkholderia multivorans]MBU9395078.1 hypothetical protein [Burkholderia multivorans]